MTDRIQGIPIMGICSQCQQLYDEFRCSEYDRRRRKWRDEAQERKVEKEKAHVGGAGSGGGDVLSTSKAGAL